VAIQAGVMNPINEDNNEDETDIEEKKGKESLCNIWKNYFCFRI
jgi:hypothetical protein